jgi:ribosomal protein S18 acetylase RimI-like enzyme
MAAVPSPRMPTPGHVVELRHLNPTQFSALLTEETEAWHSDFDWDFRPSAELVRRFLAMQDLGGHAVLDGDQVVAFAYYVSEDRKGLIGDLFVRRAWRHMGYEGALLNACVTSLAAMPGLRRIESQLMMVSPEEPLNVPLAGRARSYSRDFFLADTSLTSTLRPKLIPGRLEHWHERWSEDAAQLIPAAYRGHVDSDINDQYRSTAGARRFLHNIVQFPGCGTFFQPASLVAFDNDGRLMGMCMASLVAHDVGHLTQICVAPTAQGQGVGYELMRRSIETLRRAGCRRVSLTVTSSNREAIALYERVGFQRQRRFRAIVWDL